MPKKKSHLSNDDGAHEVELNEWDRSLIMRLAMNEYFGLNPDSESSMPVYKCKQSCMACSENKPNFPLDDRLFDKLFSESDEDLVLSKEDREAINKDLIHDFFKKKWEDENPNRKITNINKEKHEDKTETNKATLGASAQSTNKNDKPHVPGNNTINEIKNSLKEKLRLDTNSHTQDNLCKETEEDECYDFRYKNNVRKNETQYKEVDRMKKTGASIDYDKTEKQNNCASYYRGTAASTSYNSKHEDCKTERNQSKGQNDPRISTRNCKNHESGDESGEEIYYSEEEDGKFKSPVRSSKSTKQQSGNRISEKYEEDECYDVRYKSKTSKNDTHTKEGNRLKTTEYAQDNDRNKKQNSYETYYNRISPSTSYNGKFEDTQSERGQSKSQTSLKSSIRRKEYQESDYDTDGELFSEDEDDRNARNKTRALNKQNTRRLLPPNALSMNRPMDDPNSKFYIDKKWIDRNMYVKGLTKEKWNPTQSLYEIGTKCGWTRPEYIVTRVGSKNDTPRFTCEAIINGESFVTDHAVSQKKLAQHLASTKVLNYIGFDFRCPNFKQPAFVPKPLPPGGGAGPSRVAKFSLQMSSASWSLEEVAEYQLSPKRSKL